MSSHLRQQSLPEPRRWIRDGPLSSTWTAATIPGSWFKVGGNGRASTVGVPLHGCADFGVSVRKSRSLRKRTGVSYSSMCRWRFSTPEYTNTPSIKASPDFVTTAAEEEDSSLAMKLLKSIYLSVAFDIALGMSLGPWATIWTKLAAQHSRSALASTSTAYSARFFILTPHVDDILQLRQEATTKCSRCIKREADREFCHNRHGRHVERVLGMQISRDRAEGALTTSQEHYVKAMLTKNETAECNPVYTTGQGPVLSLNQTEEKVMDKAEV